MESEKEGTKLLSLAHPSLALEAWGPGLGFIYLRRAVNPISTGVGNRNPLQYSYLVNPMDRGAWWATVYGVVKSWTQLRD